MKEIENLERCRRKLQVKRTTILSLLENVIASDPPLYNHNIQVGDVVRVKEEGDLNFGFIGKVTKLTKQRISFESKHKSLQKTFKFLEVVGRRSVPRYHEDWGVFPKENKDD